MNIEELRDFCLSLPAEITQASHFARRQWMTVLDESRFSRAEWEHYIRQSYQLVIAKLPRKVRENIVNNER
jgi:predicted DNA-binding protein (MmcQ/YjbR family)